MLKKVILTVALSSSVFLCALEPLNLQVGKAQTVDLPNGKYTFSITEDALTIVVDSTSKVLPALKRQYAKPQWNLWKGEAIGMLFSAYGGWPAYHFRINPSGYFFQSFLANTKWKSSSMTGAVKFTENGWRCTFTLPFAAVETADYSVKNPHPNKYFLPSGHWKFALTRYEMTPDGKVQANNPAGLRSNDVNRGLSVKIPHNVISPFQQVVMLNTGVTRIAQNGTGKITGNLWQLDAKKPAITGKVAGFFFCDGKKSKITEVPVTCLPGRKVRFEIPYKIEEQGGKFFFTVEFRDAAGKLLRTSANLPAENPWAE